MKRYWLDPIGNAFLSAMHRDSHRTSFAPEMTSSKHNERDRMQTKPQQNQRS
jgi:hypothetical protein